MALKVFHGDSQLGSTLPLPVAWLIARCMYWWSHWWSFGSSSWGIFLEWEDGRMSVDSVKVGDGFLKSIPKKDCFVANQSISYNTIYNISLKMPLKFL